MKKKKNSGRKQDVSAASSKYDAKKQFLFEHVLPKSFEQNFKSENLLVFPKIFKK